MKSGATVVEYTSDIFKNANVDADDMDMMKVRSQKSIHPPTDIVDSSTLVSSSNSNSNVLFKLTEIVTGECTWNSEQKLYIYNTVS